MCHAVICKTCGKPTWAGCGRHIERALVGVPHSQRCSGHAKEESPGLLVRLLGRHDRKAAP
jgi:hypothetical protein